MRRVASPAGVDHDLADDLLVPVEQPGWPPRARSFSRRSCRNSAATRPARPGRRRGKRRKKGQARPPGRNRAARAKAERRREGPRAGTESRRGRSRGQRAGCNRRLPRETPRPGSAFGRVPVPAASTRRSRRRLRRPPPRPRAARPGCRRQGIPRREGQRPEAPQHLGFFWHRTRLPKRCPARRRPENKRDDSHRPRHRRGMDLAGVCLTVDALHSLADLNKRVLARGGHVIFVIKGNQPRAYQALNDIGWEQIPAAAATFEADRGRVETRTIQVAPVPEGLKYPGRGAGRDRAVHHLQGQEGQDRHPQRDRPDPHHRQPGSGAARGPARPQPRALGRHRGHPLDPRHRPERGLLPGQGPRRGPLHGYYR